MSVDVDNLPDKSTSRWRNTLPFRRALGDLDLIPSYNDIVLPTAWDIQDKSPFIDMDSMDLKRITRKGKMKLWDSNGYNDQGTMDESSPFDDLFKLSRTQRLYGFGIW
ncbi:hypothetical protein C2G38_2158077 [Gigaspora rosea]|uniref:Uncharacterized protein n=1 Tax=Gigaspora rosea TaxID=44941 RepID=A0A397W2I2_9GLOM|nr:hypothetical protein C2G38_2158077 [Gigaspora rosea]